MKKFGLMLLVMGFVIGLGSNRVYGAETSSSEEVRYWDYVIASLEEVNSFEGQVWNLPDPGDDSFTGEAVNFAAYMDGKGTARTTIGCSVGWYRGYGQWKNQLGDQLFYGYNYTPTWFRSGAQAMALPMSVNAYRLVSLQIKGGLVPDQGEIWVNGERAWRSESGVWRFQAYKPWNFIGQEVEVIWSGHGGWKLVITADSLRNGITVDLTKIDETLKSPTRLKVISFLETGSYLEEDGLIKCAGVFYSQEFGCQVLQINSLFNSDIKDLVVTLMVYDKNLGRCLNYFTDYREIVGEVVFIPLGDVWVRSGTSIKVVFVDPRSGAIVYRWLYLEEDGGGKG